jgi:hypothetical protein
VAIGDHSEEATVVALGAGVLGRGKKGKRAEEGAVEDGGAPPFYRG